MAFLEEVEHQVVLDPSLQLDRYKKWMCACGFPLQENVMGPALVKEFQAHQQEEAVKTWLDGQFSMVFDNGPLASNANLQYCSRETHGV